MKRLATVTFTIAAACNAYAQMSIKDLVLGESLDAAVEKFSLRCQSRDGGAARQCIAYGARHADLQTVAGVPATRVMVVGTTDQKIGYVMMTFAEQDFPAVRRAFASRYTRMKCKDSAIQNRMGTRFDQTECEHNDASGTLSLSRRASDVDTGLVEIRSRQFDAEERKEMELQKGKAKKDI